MLSVIPVLGIKNNMAEISDEQMETYRDAFALFDKRGDNKIALSDLGNALRALGLNPTEVSMLHFIYSMNI